MRETASPLASARPAVIMSLVTPEALAVMQVHPENFWLHQYRECFPLLIDHPQSSCVLFRQHLW